MRRKRSKLVDLAAAGGRRRSGTAGGAARDRRVPDLRRVGQYRQRRAYGRVREVPDGQGLRPARADGPAVGLCAVPHRVAFIAGFAIRWAGLICAFNFIVALVMVDAPLGIRPAFPAAALVVIGLLFATIGAGRLSIEGMFAPQRR
ncbi:hypothetical protein DdX_21473 [Ditylenchus destructor]|uniref:Uncharacterized protein n=1 Tax=Ditylenchus destructor TaxID=166010 RepID=A0AAD4MH91_9BILA|nr:hypothetical protein DdX_21473 [Ditylenchus destructor]